MTFLVYTATDRGQVRPHNEDAVFPRPAGGNGQRTDSVIAHSTGTYHLWAVADGMGGHARGEVASAMALESLQEYLAYGAWAEPAAALRAAFELANRRVHDEGGDMGTTLVAALVHADSGRFWVANVGDSRAYVIAGSQVQQLTEDHSEVAARVAAGQMTREEAAVSQRRNVLLRAIGPDPVVGIDVFGPFRLAPGQRLLLCSDGLHGMLSDTQMGELAWRSTLAAAPDQLVAAANAAGGRDNITILIGALAEAEPTVVEAFPALARSRPRPVGAIPFAGRLAMGGFFAIVFVASGSAIFFMAGGGGDKDSDGPLPATISTPAAPARREANDAIASSSPTPMPSTAPWTPTPTHPPLPPTATPARPTPTPTPPTATPIPPTSTPVPPAATLPAPTGLTASWNSFASNWQVRWEAPKSGDDDLKYRLEVGWGDAACQFAEGSSKEHPPIDPSLGTSSVPRINDEKKYCFRIMAVLGTQHSEWLTYKPAVVTS
jgi:protein phosphatase